MDTRNQPIGVFDSGVGGLSVLLELQRLLPNERFVFFADQRHVPYGGKTKVELVLLTTKIMEFLVSQRAKLVVAACNTATCHAIDELRQRFVIPIIGTVPAIKPAATQTKTGKIAMIATPATASSDYVTELIEKHAWGVEVLRVGCAGLEDCVETGQLRGPETITLLKHYIDPLREVGIDHLVLGCTHYPFLRQQISAILGSGIALVDSGTAVSKRVEMVLAEQQLQSRAKTGADQFFTNKDASDFSRVATELMGRTISASYVNL